MILSPPSLPHPLLHLLIILLKSLGWKSSRHQIPSGTSARELVQTNSCSNYQWTISVTGHFIPHGACLCIIRGKKNRTDSGHLLLYENMTILSNKKCKLKSRKLIFKTQQLGFFYQITQKRTPCVSYWWIFTVTWVTDPCPRLAVAWQQNMCHAGSPFETIAVLRVDLLTNLHSPLCRHCFNRHPAWLEEGKTKQD